MKRAFTLIELLVVIAIIAILAAILFPVFAQAKAAAKKTQSLSNAKQITLGALMYNTDSDGMFPAGVRACWWHPIDYGWEYSIQPYIKNNQIFQSPLDSKSKANWPDWMESAGGVSFSYAANGYMKDPGSGWGMYGIMGLDQANIQYGRADGTNGEGCTGPDPWMTKGETNETEISKSAETIMLAEVHGAYQQWGQSDFLTGVNWWDYVGVGGLIPDSQRTGNPYMVDGGTGSKVFSKNDRNGAVNSVDVSDPTKGSAVFTFADGHAKSMNPVATNPDPNDQSKNLWDSSLS
jgi:prepilin-type N-terminal cleavage/methylation domain-containing protein